MFIQKKEEHHHITLVYDSITNAVFKSQVITPLLNRIKHQPDQSYHLLSFEKETINIPHYDRITFTLFKRYSYLNSLSLWPAIKQTRHYLNQFQSYTITARGPFAGYIALHAVTNGCQQIIIQARGLAAQEYAYVHQQHYSWFKRLRTRLLHRLEKAVYGTRQKNVLIEAVSPALKQYLIETFNADPRIITLAEHDIPPALSHDERITYRKAIRTQLQIPDNRIVYCYSGSYKTWQCPDETFELFLQKYHDDAHCYLLILTQDIAAFHAHAQRIPLLDQNYHICSVQTDELYHYLAAADYGILLRKPHIINYVSRPTKAIEYHAAGLEIIHNGTVDYIKEMRLI